MFFVFFIFIIPLSVLLIVLYASRQKTDDEATPTEQLEVCAICHNDFPIKQLIEKEVGLYGRVYCFCWDCIDELHNDFNRQIGINQENN